MKTLILVRHAKSSWDTAAIDDFDRPLNERGKKDAPEMGKRLNEKGLKFDALLTSPARRAYKTAKLFANELDFDTKKISVVEALYHASVLAFLQTIKNVSDNYNTIIIFSHNPGITDFANTLTNVRIDDMPTCAIYGVQANTHTWTEFSASDKKFLFFDYPKNPLENYSSKP